MVKYMLIESRDSFESNDAQNFYDMASGLAKAGNEVTLFLVQNGVLPARAASKQAGLAALAQSGVTILADEFSLRERGIAAASLAGGIEPAPLDRVIDHMAGGAKTIWH